MARVSTYLNFGRHTEQAFEFYAQVFQLAGALTVHRMGDAPAHPDHPLAGADKNLVMHVELPILGGHVLMGTDAPESMGFGLNMGNSSHINLEPDTRTEADRLFAALAIDGKVTMPLQDMFWGAYFGSVTDQFDVQWMVNCAAKN
jgi:PhnB protein